MPFNPVVALENAVGSDLAFRARFGGAPFMVAGRYEILRLLGRGARGVVCEAVDQELQRPVALKLVPRVEDDDGDVRVEARMLARLHHPNVIAVHDTGLTSVVTGSGVLECFFVCMELVRGENMRAWLRSPRAPREVFRVMTAAAEGLLAAHDAGVVHRDFKPENVVIGVDGEVRVIDFGLARVDPTAFGEFVLRGENTAIVGTAGYMAPEALRGYPPDPSSDQYAFAVTLCEAITSAERGDDVGPDVGITLGPPRLPVMLRRAVLRAMDEDSTRRHPDMRFLVDRLRGMSQGPLQRHRSLALGAAGAVGGIAIAVAVMSGGAEDSGRADAAPATSPAVATPVKTPTDSPSEKSAGPPQPSGAEPAPPKSPAVVEDDPCPELAAAAGRWKLRTEVSWGLRISMSRVVGEYDFEVRRSGCQLSTTLTRSGYGERREQGGQVTLVPGTRKAISPALVGTHEFSAQPNDSGRVFEGDYTLRGGSVAANYRFAVRFVDGAWTGTWHRRDRRGAAESRGIVTTVRSDGTSTLARLDDLPCSAQCDLLCGGPRAVGECREESCQGSGGKSATCGPPDSEFRVSRLSQPPDDYKPSNEVCDELRSKLPGSWRAQVRRPSGLVQSYKLTLVVEPDCRITGWREDGNARAPLEGRFRHERPVSMVHLLSSGEHWYLTGWGYAFGLGRNGETIALYREG